MHCVVYLQAKSILEIATGLLQSEGVGSLQIGIVTPYEAQVWRILSSFFY
jgi:hypothetical protein